MKYRVYFSLMNQIGHASLFYNINMNVIYVLDYILYLFVNYVENFAI